MTHGLMKLIPTLALASIVISGCAPSAPPPAATAPAAKIPISGMPKVQAAPLLDHIRQLSSDEFEGRAPGSPGEERTVQYLTAEFQKLGLKPGNTDGTYVQKVPLVGITCVEVKPLTVSGKARATFKWRDEVVAWTKHVAAGASIENSDLVFVGYGVVAPEYGWDDFKGVDLKGKTMVVLVNDPQVPDPSDPSKLDARTFNGAAMTYYGRWTYKFEEAARRGAAGALIVHETGPAGYPFAVVQGNLSEKFDLVTPDKNMGRANIEGWLSLEASKRLLKLGGQDFDALKKQATTRDFKPVPLGLKASLAVKNTLRTIDSRNVLAKLDGSDPQLKDEFVVYTAHWDHYGIGVPVNGDVTPVYPLAKTLANINIDGINQWGRTKDITVIGLGASDLDDYLRDAAAEQSRTLRPDPEAEKGFYYRSDHFNFAKQGVPALYTDTGIEYIGKPPEYATTKRDEYNKVDYHQPSDQIKPDWDLAGAVEDAELMVAVGYRVANADKFPEWKPGNEFRAKREEMMKK